MKECVWCCVVVGKSVGEGNGRVIDGVLVFKGFFGDFKYWYVGFVVFVEEVEE